MTQRGQHGQRICLCTSGGSGYPNWKGVTKRLKSASCSSSKLLSGLFMAGARADGGSRKGACRPRGS